ncbi:hypothetical protein RFI_29917, partial [Reticulomyxa filosa]
IISVWTINGELLAYVVTGQSVHHSVSCMSVNNLRDWQSSSSCVLITGHKDGSLRFWSLAIPNGAKEVLDQKRVTAMINHQTKIADDSESTVEISKLFSPKLPSYQKRRMAPELNVHKYNSKYNADYNSTSLKQLAGDTTLRFKPMCTKSKKQVKPITQIHASTSTHQFLWTGDAEGKIIQWEIRTGFFSFSFYVFVCLWVKNLYVPARFKQLNWCSN